MRLVAVCCAILLGSVAAPADQHDHTSRTEINGVTLALEQPRHENAIEIH